MRKDTVGKTIFVATAICVVCSILVSVTAVQLRPEQALNRELDRQKNILEAAGLFEIGMDVEEVFSDRIEARLLDLESGELLDQSVPRGYDQKRLERNPETSIAIPPEQDKAGIKRRVKEAAVYLVKEGDAVKKIILPVHGKGLWSTMYGFFALESDTRTIAGITFYEHGETPGLGGEVDNPRWKQSWNGKLAFDEEGDIAIEVIKGAVDTSRGDSKYKIDGLSGATITSRGVSQMMRYWLSENGYGPFLQNFRERSQADG